MASSILARCTPKHRWIGPRQLSNHDVVAFEMGAQLECPGAVDGKAALSVKVLSALVFLIDAEPYTLRAPFGGGREGGIHQSRRHARAVMLRQHIHLRELCSGSNVHGSPYVGIVVDAADQHG